MFSGEMDANNCFIEIQAGSGGTEAQDWASMLLRMYLRYCERKGFQVEILEQSGGEVGRYQGCLAQGQRRIRLRHLRTRPACTAWCAISPFDSGNRRHTSFSSVFVYPEVDESIEIEINPADLRVDTYRASARVVSTSQNRLRGAHYPRSHRHCGAVPERPLATPQTAPKRWQMLKSRMYEAELR